MLIVCKFGGTSLADAPRIQAAAGRMKKLAQSGHQAVAVVSAQGDTTDAMIHTAAQVSTCPTRREMDAYLAAGEQMSGALMAMALEAMDCPAVSLTGWQAGICTDGEFGNARITKIQTERIRRELDSGRIVVVAGFQGMSPPGDVTTLGRGGSDTTAVALAAWLGAKECRIYTDVDGVYTSDPRKDAAARRYDRIGYDAMLHLIREGAQVLHDRCVELAQDQKITLEVRSAFTDAPGTLVGDVSLE